KEMAIVEPKHCKCTWLDHHDLTPLANVLEQDFACLLRLLLRCLNQALGERCPAIGGDLGQDHVDADRAKDLDCGDSPFGRSVVRKDIGEERDASAILCGLCGL